MQHIILMQQEIIEKLVELSSKLIDELSQYKAIDEEEKYLSDITSKIIEGR